MNYPEKIEATGSPVWSNVSSSTSPESVLPTTGHYAIRPEQNTFTSLMVDLTHRCNMECANCYLPNRDIPDMEVEKLFDVLKRLPNRTYIRLLGAEPTMREDLPEIICEVIRLGHRPSIITNGLKLAHMDYCNDLKAAGLRHVVLSMNGSDDDTVYRILDNGKYANLKTRALTNIFRSGMCVNTGTIVAKGINENAITRQITTLVDCAQRAGVNFNDMTPWSRIAPVLRIKTVGSIGRYMEDRDLDFDELIALTSDQLRISESEIRSHAISPGLNYISKDEAGAEEGYAVPVDTEIGKIYVRLVNWTINNAGVPNAGSQTRGRITKDWQIAPFFEDVKANEFGY
jgi:uncharacterized Fe-S cluster-containing radical SAM superfamily protein